MGWENGAFGRMKKVVYEFLVEGTGGLIKGTSLQATGLTAGRVPIVGASGLLADDGDLTFATDTLTATGLAVGATGLVATGAITPTGGIVATVDRVPNIPIGAVALGSLGTNTTPVAGTLYFASVWLDANKTITGIAQLNGSAVGTDKTIVSLWNSAGTLVANSDLAGTTCVGTDAWQEVAFTGTYAAKGPGRFWVGVQVNGTTCRLRTIAASTYLNFTGSSTPGAFGTIGSSITPPTATAADKGPIAYLY